MGDPKKIKKKFAKPRHPWQKARIEQEKVLVIEFGLKNKREIYRVNTMISRIIDHFKVLNVQTSEQAQKEKDQLLSRVKRLGLVKADADISAVLDVKVRDALDRRLQTVVYKKKLARSVKQARQFITHRHILVNGQVIDAPGYLVQANEENAITFVARSALFSDLHPERVSKEKAGAAAAAARESTEKLAESSKDASTDNAQSSTVELAIEDDVETQ